MKYLDNEGEKVLVVEATSKEMAITNLWESVGIYIKILEVSELGNDSEE